MAKDDLDSKLSAKDSVKRSYVERELRDQESNRRFSEIWAAQELENFRAEERKKVAYQNMYRFSESVLWAVTSSGYLACKKWFGTYGAVKDYSSLIETGFSFERHPKPNYYKLNAYVVEPRYKKKRLWGREDTSACIGRICMYFDLDGNPLNDTKPEMVIYGEKNVDEFMELEKVLLGISIGREIKGFDKDVFYKEEQKAKITSFY